MPFLLLSLLFFGSPLTAPPPPQPAYYDAMVTWRANKMYAFYGAYYYRFDLATNRMDPGYPKTIAGNWQLPFQRIDAALNMRNGKAFFFSGNQYVRYDVNTDRADPGYPKTLNPAWNLPWQQVDGALYWGNSVFYLFNNATGTYVRYRVGASAPDAGYPKYTATEWKVWPFPNVGAATSYSGRAYISNGNSYNRLFLSNASAEAGYPRNISYLPDIASGGTPNAGYTAPAAPPTYTPPPTYNTPPPVTPSNSADCRINGTLVYKGNGTYQQWNNVNVELHSANSYFTGRYNQLIAQGYTPANAMSACVREDGLWTRGTSSVTKPTTLNSPKYGMAYSWFGFVNLKPGTYRVFVPGYPNLSRWCNFTAGGQKLEVNLEAP